MNVLVPFRTQFPPRRTAVMRALPASEPEEGSVSPQAPMNSPLASLGIYFFFSASLPARKMWFEQSDVCAATMIPTEPSTRESSSIAVTYSTYPIPAPPSSAGNTMPISPSLPSSLTVESGKSPASSHLRTCGAISRSANSRTLFFSCSCSSFSWKSTDLSCMGKVHYIIDRRAEEARVPTGWLSRFLLGVCEDSPRHPQRGHKKSAPDWLENAGLTLLVTSAAPRNDSN